MFLTVVDQYQQLVYSQRMFLLSNGPRPGKEFNAESAKAWLELHEAEIKTPNRSL
jgi:hypothetical protein